MYRAPVKDVRFVFRELVDESALQACSAFADYSPDLADAVLEEAAKFADNVLEPLCRSGDREAARWTPEGVVTPSGFKAAYQQYIDGGWSALRASAHYGGQAAPTVLGTAVEEFWGGANLGFKLCPMLTQGAVEALEYKGSEAQKDLYLPKMVSGEWTGTMNLTEPQAGSDLAAIRTRAVPDGEHYRIFGQKIFITYGDHDYTPNIIHMVLARIDGAPPGVKGISLFIVPKFIPDAGGAPGVRNDVHCLSIEHKLGIHASPTCVLAFGQNDGAIGYLVGEPNRGLEYMFVMMNAARLSVGLEGYAVAERAFQQAAEWARTRVQGKPPVAAASGPLPIIHHPDVKRMLLSMKSQVEAMRALGLYAAFQLDLGGAHPDAAQRAAAQARGELLIPIVKGWSTENGIEIASTGIQVHGGMGYIEETGAAQALRDVRITAIYEGTTGIQSNDLIGRKLARDRGAAMAALLADMERELAAIDSSTDAAVRSAQQAAREGVATLRAAVAVILEAMATAPERAFAVSVPFLKLCGTVIGGWLLAKAAAAAARRLAAGDVDREFLAGKLASARFYAEQVLPQAAALGRVVTHGAASVVEVDAALI
ncbi:MAG: acyl-CoA dehydrogenase [Sinobacteraceae bacterium]|nr:acyl-CoA dehydrogenase [Nevskiaceae bacterium]MCP5470667.1 acyl-CoA dehydrogenase [Nevskiaceae bacterium]